MVRSRAQGQLSSCESNEKNIGTALEMYSTDNKGLYPATSRMSGGLTPDYLKVIPTCASAGTDTYTLTYISQSKPDAYTFYCNGYNHGGAGTGPNFPEYNSAQGLILK